MPTIAEINQCWENLIWGENDSTSPLGVHCYREIGSKNDDTSFETMQKVQSEALATRFDEPPSCEFRNHTIDQIYDYYKRHLRPADDAEGSRHFSAFTFAAIDEACLRSDPQQLVLCSDAPDFGEADDEIVLKQVRMKATIASVVILRLEDLSLTPKEAELKIAELGLDRHDVVSGLDKHDVVTLQMQPSPANLVRADQSPSFRGSKDEVKGELVPATPGQARAKKRAGIKAAVGMGWVLGKGWPDGKEGQSVDCFN